MSVCALPDGLALIWELGSRGTLMLLRVRTHNVGHRNRGHRVTDMGILKGGCCSDPEYSILDITIFLEVRTEWGVKAGEK